MLEGLLLVHKPSQLNHALICLDFHLDGLARESAASWASTLVDIVLSSIYVPVLRMVSVPVQHDENYHDYQQRDKAMSMHPRLFH